MKNIVLINILIMLLATASIAQHGNLLNNKISLAKKYEQTGELEKAKQIYNDIIAEQPWNSEIVRSLNDIYLKLKEYDNSIILIREKLNANPSDPNLWGLLGFTYSTMGNNKKAYETWDQGFKINKASIASYRVIADYAIQKRAFDKAIEILSKGKEIINDPMIFTYDLGNLYSVTMEFEGAAQTYCDLLLTNPEQIGSVQSRMNRYLIHPNASGPTIETVKRYYEEYNRPIYLDLLSFLYMKDENYSKALEVIIQKDKILETNGLSVFNFARTVFHDGDYATSAEAYKFLINNYKTSSYLPDAKLGFTRAMEEKLNLERIDSSQIWKPFTVRDTAGSFRYKQIVNDYEEIANTYFKDNIVASAKLRIGIINQNIYNNPEEAEKIFNDLNKSRLSAVLIPEITERLAEISIVKNDLNGAKKLYQVLEKVSAANPDKKSLANFMSAKISFWNGDFPEAEKLLGDISQNLSDDYANDAIELSIIISTLKKDSLNLLQFAKADLLTKQNKYEEAAKIFKTLADNKRLMILNDISKYKYAQIKIAQNNYGDAVPALEELAGGVIENVYSDKALYLLGNSYLYALNNQEKASITFQKLLDTFPGSLYFDETRHLLNIISKGYKQTI